MGALVTRPDIPSRTVGIAAAAPALIDSFGRVEGTVALLERRGYAVSPQRLGEICLGGPLPTDQVLDAARRSPMLELREGLVISGSLAASAPAIAARCGSHASASPPYVRMTLEFVRTLVALNPYILAVSIAGSLASGGFRASDDIDLNLVVEDGRRHLAYVALNALGLLHALPRRRKPVDAHTRRPLAPRLMTANLILECSQCFPLARQDTDMAYELLASQPVFGAGFWAEVCGANPSLGKHFPQLGAQKALFEAAPARRLPRWAFPALLDRPCYHAGRAAWRCMQWTRRREPEALARVAFVRKTMRPYALFDDSCR